MPIVFNKSPDDAPAADPVDDAIDVIRKYLVDQGARMVVEQGIEMPATLSEQGCQGLRDGISGVNNEDRPRGWKFRIVREVPAGAALEAAGFTRLLLDIQVNQPPATGVDPNTKRPAKGAPGLPAEFNFGDKRIERAIIIALGGDGGRGADAETTNTPGGHGGDGGAATISRANNVVQSLMLALGGNGGNAGVGFSSPTGGANGADGGNGAKGTITSTGLLAKRNNATACGGRGGDAGDAVGQGRFYGGKGGKAGSAEVSVNAPGKGHARTRRGGIGGRGASVYTRPPPAGIGGNGGPSGEQCTSRVQGGIGVENDVSVAASQGGNGGCGGEGGSIGNPKEKERGAKGGDGGKGGNTNCTAPASSVRISSAGNGGDGGKGGSPNGPDGIGGPGGIGSPKPIGSDGSKGTDGAAFNLNCTLPD